MSDQIKKDSQVVGEKANAVPATPVPASQGTETKKAAAPVIQATVSKTSAELQKSQESTKQAEAPKEVVASKPSEVSVDSVDKNLQEEMGVDFSEDSLEETLGGLKDDLLSDTDSIFDQAIEMTEEAKPTPSQAELKVVPSSSASYSSEKRGPSQEDGQLALNLSGQMKLKLSYTYSDQEVVVSFDNESLVVQLENGAEFKIPMKSSKKSLKVAS